jgi:hypothetical protein
VQAGSFNTVAPLYGLRKKDMVHVLCTTTGQSNAAGLVIYKPVKLYVIQDEDMNTVLKTFKFEVKQVKSHFEKAVETEPTSLNTPEKKRKAAENHMHSSPGWSSPPRRLKINTTDEAAAIGISK